MPTVTGQDSPPAPEQPTNGPAAFDARVGWAASCPPPSSPERGRPPAEEGVEIEPRALFEQNLDLIARLSFEAARTSRFADADREEFTSEVYVKLLEDDGRRLRAFRGRSSLETYLRTVIWRLMMDFRNANWGKWRPSALARRLGADAVELERLLERDRVPVRAALDEIVRRSGGRLVMRDVVSLYRQLPIRLQRSLVCVDVASQVTSLDGADAELWEAEDCRTRDAARAIWRDALEGLPAEDRLIMRLRFLEGFSVADIARALGLEGPPTYKRIERNCRTIRAAFEEAGLLRGDLFEGAR